jgi:hypothetical protein
MSWVSAWIDDIGTMIEQFGTVVTKGQGLEPSFDLVASAVLIGMGGLLTTVSIAIFGVLTVGALYGWLTEPS